MMANELTSTLSLTHLVLLIFGFIATFLGLMSLFERVSFTLVPARFHAVQGPSAFVMGLLYLLLGLPLIVLTFLGLYGGVELSNQESLIFSLIWLIGFVLINSLGLIFGSNGDKSTD